MLSEISITNKFLKENKVILYPTDTVWGLGCDMFNDEAVKRIYQIKKREDAKALILLVSDLEMLKKYVVVNEFVKEFLSSERPTTIIYSNTKNLPSYILANDASVAIRVVKDEFCKTLITKLGNPIISTSANKSGEITAQFYSEISESILSEVDYVVNWRKEDKTVVLPSKIVKILNNGNHQIIRK